MAEKSDIPGWMAIPFFLWLVGAPSCEQKHAHTVKLDHTQSGAPEIGRFQLVQLGQMRADQYLLDTTTGRVWRSVCSAASTDLKRCTSVWQEEAVHR